jgi:hypothetical protein
MAGGIPILLLLSSWVALAQVKTFQLNEARDDISRRIGPPERWWAPEPSRYLNNEAELRAAIGIWARIDDVWTRKTEKNVYEVHAAYQLDSRESRLHPTQRLTRIELLVDKPRTWKETLPDFPETTELCAVGCKLSGYKDMFGHYAVLVYPVKPSPAQLQTGILAASAYKPESTDWEWSVAVKLILERQPSPLGSNLPVWADEKIGEIDLEPVCLQCELRDGVVSRNAAPMDLGTWQPTN